MGVSHRKIKSVSKTMIPRSDQLSKKVLSTMKLISDMVGATLGPGGCAALIERQEYGFPNLVTKDGVTVFRSLGFADPIAHAIMETARDASVRTATEAGDGTTTATVLAEAIVRYTHQFCAANPKASPQRVVRTLERFFRHEIEPVIKSLALKPDRTMLHAVAQCSANGDTELANAIMTCFDLAGDGGNITIIEQSGPSAYKVEPLKGYPVASGYEDSCMRFFPGFINDRMNSRVYLEKPVFVLYFGQLTEIQQLFGIMSQLDYDFQAWREAEQTGKKYEGEKPPSNIVVVATGFSETVLGHLLSNWSNAESMNVIPLIVPKFPVQNGQMEFLADIQAVTGATIFDSIRKPLIKGGKADVGQPLEYFEMHRYRSNIVGCADESLLMARVDEVEGQISNTSYESDYELTLLRERVGKLTGGIAKLTVVGASNGEIREKKDRAEDAACGVRGAIKHGALPGGCWSFIKLVDILSKKSAEYGEFDHEIICNVLCPALCEPLNKLLGNCGYTEEEILAVTRELTNKLDSPEPVLYDALQAEYMFAKESGVMDSVPAVLEALRNSISIASLLGTLGGVVVFPRDNELERTEASETFQFLRDANSGGE